MNILYCTRCKYVESEIDKYRGYKPAQFVYHGMSLCTTHFEELKRRTESYGVTQYNRIYLNDLDEEFPKKEN